MLITKTRLKEIIKEEISRGLEEDATQKDVQRVGDKLGKVPGLANYFSRVDTPQGFIELPDYKKEVNCELFARKI